MLTGCKDADGTSAYAFDPLRPAGNSSRSYRRESAPMLLDQPGLDQLLADQSASVASASVEASRLHNSLEDYRAMFDEYWRETWKTR